MKRLLAVIVLVLMSSSVSFALTDAEYLRMKKSSADFSRADKRLSQVWAQLKKSLPKNVFADLQKEQLEWIASGRDDEAADLMADGYSRMEAYTMATNDRADALPRIAQELRNSRVRTTQPTQRTTPKTTTLQTPEPESESPSDPAGEYQSSNCFMTVRIIDRSSMEAEVTFGRWKDGVTWRATGWIDDDILELSDSQYSTCIVTIYFSGSTARVVPSDSNEWAKITADDFDMSGTYRKN